MNQKIKIIVVLLIIGAVAYFGYHYYKKETPEEGEEVQKTESQKEIVIRELAEKYDALIGWNKDIYYTIQLQDLLVNSGKPVLFTGSVDDVFVEDGQYYIRFRTGGILSWETSEKQVYFVLKCDASKASEIMKKEAKNREGEDDLTVLYIYGSLGGFDDYVVVAEIENVTKPILQISGYSGYEGGEVELEYEPSGTFIARGTCIDFVYVKEEVKEE